MSSVEKKNTSMAFLKILKIIRKVFDMASTVIASVLCGAMMLILLVNVILRFAPDVTKYTWYMEGGSQFLNFFAIMLLIANVLLRFLPGAKNRKWHTDGGSQILTVIAVVILVTNIVMINISKYAGGFAWYMEGGQILNVYSMLLAGIGISVQRTHLHVEMIDSIAAKIPVLKKLHYVIVSLFIILFYVLVSYSGYKLATNAAVMKKIVATIPAFKWGQVYWIVPAAGSVAALAAFFDMLIRVFDKESPEKADADVKKEETDK